MKLVKRIWWIPVLLLLAVGGLVLYRNYQLSQFRAALTTVQTVRLAKGNITSTVSATGSVVSNQSATLTWPLSGQVGQVLVQVGDTVKAGQTLASLSAANTNLSTDVSANTGQTTSSDNSQTQADTTVAQARVDLVNDQQALEDLKASKVDLTTQQQALATAQAALSKAQQHRAWMNSPTHGSQTDILVAQNAYTMAEDEYQRTLKSYQGMSHMDPTALERVNAAIGLEKMRQQRDQTLATLNYLKSPYSAQEIATGDAAVALAQAQVEDAQRAYDRLKSGPTAAEIAAAQAKVAADQAVIDSVNQKAPFAGTVTAVPAYPGESVAKGDEVLRLDDLSQIYANLSVSEVDVNQVQVGQSVEISFDAIPEQSYHGTVAQVGQIGTSSSGVVSYPVSVLITDADAQVKTDMTASATITISSLNNILLVPTRSIKTVNGQKTVYLYRGGPSMPVTIQTGATSDTMTQVVSGNVKEGDAVLANPAASTTTNAPSGFFLFGLLGGGPAGGPPPGGGGPPPGGAGGPPSNGGPNM